MRIRKIPKGHGRFRTIYVPSVKEKERLRKLLPVLHELHAQAVDRHGTRGIAHAFVPNRNPVTCALPHRGFQVTVSCDLENWFDTVREDQLVAAGVPPEVAKAITIDGVCRQGLPTSPVAANIAAVAFDARLLKSLKGFTAMYCFLDFAYTRYADDITISFSFTDGLVHPDSTYADILVRLISNRVEEFGWTIAEHKTHIQHAKAGRRIIVGIAVDDRVQQTRKTRRKLRAAEHQSNSVQKCHTVTSRTKALNAANGLREWAACKLPRKARSTRQMMGVVAGSSSSPSPPGDRSSLTAVPGSTRRILIEKIADGSPNQ